MSPRADGFDCDDGNLCNGVNSCLSGQCVQDLAPVSCPPAALCNVSLGCDAATGQCLVQPAPDATPCDALKTGSWKCLAASCLQAMPGETCLQPLQLEVGQTLSGQPLGRWNIIEGEGCAPSNPAAGQAVYRVELPNGNYRLTVQPKGGWNVNVSLLEQCPGACFDTLDSAAQGGAEVLDPLEVPHGETWVLFVLVYPAEGNGGGFDISVEPSTVGPEEDSEPNIEPIADIVSSDMQQADWVEEVQTGDTLFGDAADGWTPPQDSQSGDVDLWVEETTQPDTAQPPFDLAAVDAGADAGPDGIAEATETTVQPDTGTSDTPVTRSGGCALARCEGGTLATQMLLLLLALSAALRVARLRRSQASHLHIPTRD